MSISSTLLSSSTFDKTFNSVNSSSYLLNGSTILDTNGTLTVNKIITNTLTSVSSDNISSNTLTLNYGVTGTPTLSAGITVNRGTSPNAILIWNESSQCWEIGVSGSPLDQIVTLTNNQSITGKTYNGLGITAGTGSSINIATAKTLQLDNSFHFNGTDGYTFTFPAQNDTVVGANASQTLYSKTLSSPVVDLSLLPFTNNSIDIGNSSFQFRNLYSSGTANFQTVNIQTLNVLGTTSSTNTSNLNVDNNIITLNAILGSTTAPTLNAYLQVDRGNTTNASLMWNESGTVWKAGLLGTEDILVTQNAAITLYSKTFSSCSISNGLIFPNSVAITNVFPSGTSAQGINSVLIGNGAGAVTQAAYSVAIGYNAGNSKQLGNAVAIGNSAGQTNQGLNSVAIGYNAGTTNQLGGSVAIGYYAGYTGQGISCVSVGNGAGYSGQGQNSVAVGFNSGNYGQATSCVAIGANAGYTGQGAYSVALGYGAGQSGLPANTICINASGVNLNPTTAGFFVSGLRSQNTSNQVFYNSTTNEISYYPASTNNISYITRCPVSSFFVTTNTSGNVQFGAPTDNLNWPSPITSLYQIFFPVTGYYHVDVQLGDMPTVTAGYPVNIGYNLYNSSNILVESSNLSGNGTTTDHARDNSGFVIYISNITNYLAISVYQNSGVSVNFTTGFLHMYKIN